MSSDTPRMRYCTTRSADAERSGGRREWISYFDHGATAASQGWMRAEVMRPSSPSQPTGWHYHECEGQFVYLISGWICMEFADGHVFTMEPGDSMFIPGGEVHNMRETSPEFESLEITVPADITTVLVEPPPVDEPGVLR